MKVKAITLFLALAAGSAQATTIDASCVAIGRYGSGGYNPMTTNSSLTFRLTGDADGATIRSVRGIVRVAWDYDKDLPPENLNDENAYVGHFQINSLDTNPNYRPRRYKDYFQFKKFNASRTTGNESGMWGEFVVEKAALLRRAKRFLAHYIFQAGDHIGGTLHFTCERD